MKILQVIPYFEWSYGGPVRVVYELSRELSKLGHDVTIYTTDVGMRNRLSENDKIKLDNVEIRYFPCINNKLANDAKLHISPEMNLAIKKNIKNFDIVHMHEYRGVPNIYVEKYASKYNIPYILQAHGAFPQIIVRQDLKRTASKILYDAFIGKRIVNGASKLIALTKTEAEQYRRMGVDENKIEIIPNGIDLSIYSNLPVRGEFRHKYGIKNDEKVILYLGRIHKTKGIDLLVTAFADLIKESDNIRLVLVGPDDGYRSMLEEQIKALKLDDKVLFTGFTANSEKKMAFIDADIFVTPSFSGFPITFLEACACGTPIVTTNNGDNLDWIHNKVGYVVTYDKNQLQDAIIKIISDNELRRRFSDEGMRLVRTNFGWDNIARNIEAVYETTIRVE